MERSNSHATVRGDIVLPRRPCVAVNRRLGTMADHLARDRECDILVRTPGLCTDPDSPHPL